MKLLLDANISWRLSNALKKYFVDCIHVEATSLTKPAKDIEIWNFAKINNYTILTVDTDFINLVNVYGFPPKVIVVRTGNQHTRFLQEVIINHLKDIEQLYQSPETGLLEIY
jgi:predicted nuclease of predicted toxin-antitoxin system